MDKFILSCQRKARKAKTIIELQQICTRLWNAGHRDEANKFLQRCLVKNFGWPKPKPKPKGKVGRKGGLPQPLDYEIIRLRQKGATQRAAGESVGLTSDYHVIENRVRDVERRFCEARDGSPKLRKEFEAALLLCKDEKAARELAQDYLDGARRRRKEYEAALRKQHPDSYLTHWGVLTGAEMVEALNQSSREAIEHIEKLNKQNPL
ncbi:hypothetical protein ACK3ZA_09745 [Aeromonas caviae]